MPPTEMSPGELRTEGDFNIHHRPRPRQHESIHFQGRISLLKAAWSIDRSSCSPLHQQLDKQLWREALSEQRSALGAKNDAQSASQMAVPVSKVAEEFYTSMHACKQARQRARDLKETAPHCSILIVRAVTTNAEEALNGERY